MDYKRLVRVLDSSEDELFNQAYIDKDESFARELLNARYVEVLPNSKVGGREFYKGKNSDWKNTVAGYFTDDTAFAGHYGGGDVKSFYLFIENPYQYDFQYAGSDGDYPGEDGEYRETMDVVRSVIKSEGDVYDAFILYNVGEGASQGMYDIDDYIVLDPRRVKSYDAFTFDDSGKLIPLSERFNLEVSDIRY